MAMDLNLWAARAMVVFRRLGDRTPPELAGEVSELMMEMSRELARIEAELGKISPDTSQEPLVLDQAKTLIAAEVVSGLKAIRRTELVSQLHELTGIGGHVQGLANQYSERLDEPLRGEFWGVAAPGIASMSRAFAEREAQLIRGEGWPDVLASTSSGPELERGLQLVGRWFEQFDPDPEHIKLFVDQIELMCRAQSAYAYEHAQDMARELLDAGGAVELFEFWAIRRKVERYMGAPSSWPSWVPRMVEGERDWRVLLALRDWLGDETECSVWKLNKITGHADEALKQTTPETFMFHWRRGYEVGDSKSISPLALKTYLRAGVTICTARYAASECS